MWNIDNPFLFERSKLNHIKIWWINIDKIILSITCFLILFGLFMNFSSSPSIANRIGVSELFFFKKHIILSIGAFFLLIFFSLLKINHIKTLSVPLFITIIFILFLTLLIGNEIKGAKRWISIFGFNLQPSEFAKIFFIIFHAFLLDKLHNIDSKIKYFASISTCILSVFLMILQPDFGMSFMIILLWASQLFLYGLPMISIFLISISAIIGAICAYIFLPHVRDRIDRFLDFGQNYQVEKSIDAYISGGISGLGPGNGLVKKHIPDAHSDFIFSVVFEEFGLILSLGIIFIFILLITRIVKKNQPEDGYFIYLSISGILIQFAFQIIINIGVAIGILPTKGITLPFISYGGSSLFAMSIAFGIILSMTRKKYNHESDEKDILLS
jgi:cell division protein FtsW